MTGFDLSGGCHQMVLYPSDCFQRNPIRGKYQNRHCYLERQWQKCFHAGFIIDVGWSSWVSWMPKSHLNSEIMVNTWTCSVAHSFHAIISFFHDSLRWECWFSLSIELSAKISSWSEWSIIVDTDMGVCFVSASSVKYRSWDRVQSDRSKAFSVCLFRSCSVLFLMEVLGQHSSYLMIVYSVDSRKAFWIRYQEWNSTDLETLLERLRTLENGSTWLNFDDSRVWQEDRLWNHRQCSLGVDAEFYTV